MSWAKQNCFIINDDLHWQASHISWNRSIVFRLRFKKNHVGFDSRSFLSITVKHWKEENHIHSLSVHFFYNQLLCRRYHLSCIEVGALHHLMRSWKTRSLPLTFYIHMWGAFDTRLLLRPFFLQVGSTRSTITPLCRPLRNGGSHVMVSHCRPLPCFKFITFAYRANLHYYKKSKMNPVSILKHSEICPKNS